MTAAQVIRSIWLVSSVGGLAFFIVLLSMAQKEVALRRRKRGRRSLSLLAWKSWSVPATLTSTFFLDIVAGGVTLFMPNVFISVSALICSNLFRVALGGYLLWSNDQIKKSGTSEIVAERARLLAGVKAPPQNSEQKGTNQ